MAFYKASINGVEVLQVSESIIKIENNSEEKTKTARKVTKKAQIKKSGGGGYSNVSANKNYRIVTKRKKISNLESISG